MSPEARRAAADEIRTRTRREQGLPPSEELGEAALDRVAALLETPADLDRPESRGAA